MNYIPIFQVKLYYTQINGMWTGWKYGVERSSKPYETDISNLYWLNFVHEAAEFQRKLNISLGEDPIERLPSLGSAFLRVVDAKAEDGTPTKKLYVSHNAAESYSSMTRLLKRYKLNYHKTAKSPELVHGTSIAFSGYPGSITSQDEFYIINGENHRMAVTGTALRNYNSKLWKDVSIMKHVSSSFLNRKVDCITIFIYERTIFNKSIIGLGIYFQDIFRQSSKLG